MYPVIRPMSHVATAPAMAPLIIAAPVPQLVGLVRRDICASASSVSVADKLGSSQSLASDSSHRARAGASVLYSLTGCAGLKEESVAHRTTGGNRTAGNRAPAGRSAPSAR